MTTASLRPCPPGADATRLASPGAFAARLAGAVLAAAVAVVAGLVSCAPARAADDAPAEPPAGMTVQFPAVLTADTAVHLRQVVYAPLKRYQAYHQRLGQATTGFKLLCDFNPDGRADATNDYGACSDLADVLRDLQQKSGVKTRAFVHGDVSRHAVLPVLACGEIVMSADPPAHLGPIADSDLPLDEAKQKAYDTMAHDHFPPAVVRKMYDKNLVVVKVFPAGKDADRFIDQKEADRAKPPLNSEPVPGLGAGGIAFYNFDQAKEFGLLHNPPEPQNHLADACADFGLPSKPVYALMDQIIAYRIKVEGAIDGRLQEDLDRRLDHALNEKANVLVLDLECGGGDDHTAYEVGQSIARLKTRADRPIKTIAYVSSSATDTAVFLALACDEIVMQKDARLGDFESYLQEHPDRVEKVREELRETAESGAYPPALAEGMANPDLRVVRADDGAVLTWQEWNNNKNHGANETEIKPAGTYLKLPAADAQRVGLAEKVVNDYNDLCTQENVKPIEIEGDWLNALAEFLRSPWMSVVLVMIGVTCLIIELKMPGASLPGVIAAVCFVLFFWSESQLAGQITWLAVLLFILGLLLIGIEVFILPGTGVCGISGALLTVGGLALVAFGHWPQTTQDWMGFGEKLGPFSIGVIVSVALAFILVRYLKHIPFLNRLILKPPGEAGADGESSAPEPLQPELAALLGAIGVAATPLRPAGKTQFGDQFVDVVAEGGYVRPGARVQVIEIEGNRVVVKEV